MSYQRRYRCSCPASIERVPSHVLSSSHLTPLVSSIRVSHRRNSSKERERARLHSTSTWSSASSASGDALSSSDGGGPEAHLEPRQASKSPRDTATAAPL